MFRRLLHRLYLTCWYGVVVTIILLAVLVTLARTLFPSVERYRAEIEQWVGGQLGSPVTLGGIDARFEGLTPHVVLREATLRDAAGAPLVRFGEARLGVDLLDSLLQGAPVITEFAVRGAELAVERLPDGRIRVHGVAAGEGEGAEQDLGALLLGRGRWQLSDLRITWRDRRLGTPDLLFAADRVELTNLGDRHLLEARVRLPEAMGRELRFAADLTGNPIAGGDWRGSSYLEGRAITPAPWLAGWQGASPALAGGAFDLKLWADWRDGLLQAATGELAAAGLRFKGEEGPLDLEGLGLRFEAQRQGEGWRLAADDLTLRRAGRSHGPLRLRLEGEPQRLEFTADRLPLEELAALLPLLPGLDEGVRRQAAESSPAGELRQLRARLVAGELAELRCDFEGVAVRPVGALPGATALAGRLRWQAPFAELSLRGQEGVIELPRLFRGPLPVGSLAASLRAERADGGLTLEIPSLSLSNADLRLELSGGLQLPAAGEPLISLSGRFFDAQAIQVPRYLPARVMPPDSVKWLDAAFKAGRVPNGVLRVYGPLERFPFEAGEGLFLVRFPAEGVQLHFQEGWPDLTEVAGEVLFQGVGMVIEASGARLFDSRVEAVRVGIDDLDNATLWVEGLARLSENDPLRLLTETPLKKKFASYTYPGLRFAGEAGLDLNLIIPLEKKDPSPLRVNGALALKGGSLALADGLTAERLEGRLEFNESQVHSERITGQLLGGPVEIKVVNERQGGGRTRVAGAGSAAVSALRRFLGSPLLDQLSGKASWRGSLTLPHEPAGKGAEAGVSLEIASDLTGLLSTLPAPLAKRAEEAAPIALGLALNGPRKGQLSFDYAGRIGAVLQLAEGPGQGIERGALRFGGGAPRLPEGRELKIEGALEGIESAAWGELLGGLRGEEPARAAAGEKPVPPLDITIDLERLGLRPRPERVGPQPPAEPVAAAEAEESEPPPARNRPPRRIRVRVGRLSYGDELLGELRFKAEPRETVTLQELSLEGELLELTGHGFVIHDQVVPRTEMKLELTAADTGRMLAALGFASVIAGGRFGAEGNLVWPGDLTDFTPKRLGGAFHLAIEEGSIVDLKPGAGRLLGLFSLQALPSRLTLDFRDLFESALRFTRIEGEFRLTDGDAFTDNLVMEANAAEVRISGRTGLGRRDYDQQVTVVPRVGDSLSVAGGLAWGPQVGAALLIFQKIFQGQIDKAASSRYRVVGSWEQPKVEKIDPQPPTAGALPPIGQ